MISFSDQIDGDEWQEFVIQLLFMRYGANLIEVPDQHKGDSGIEAFSTDGCAFQCYAPEGQTGFAETAAKHKKKITQDIKKFRCNRDDLIKIFGTTKIKRWLLVVPDHCSSEVVVHCQSKTAEIRNFVPPLPYVDSDFQVLTVNGHSFLADEIAKLTTVGGLLVEAEQTVIAPNDLFGFLQQNDEWIGNLDRKLEKLPALSSDQDRAALKEKFFRFHLEGSNAIAYYDNHFPVISDKIRRLKQTKSTSLEIESKLQSLTISSTREKFEVELVNCVPALGRQTAMTVSWASIAEWLMVCPLDPKG
jgi:hypothetical protein